MNIPTRAEINSLNNKITRLTKKVDELKKEAV
jgi:polyhydroxyalkanoate synthesis regulator phasin